MDRPLREIILADWNEGELTYKEICEKHNLRSRGVVSGTLGRARERGENVREGPHVQRDKRIVDLWNQGLSDGEIIAALPENRITRHTVSSAIRRARQRGEKIAKHQHGGPRMRRAPFQPAKNPDDMISASTLGHLHAQLRKARMERTLEEVIQCLPDKPRQCRWLDGDYLKGDLKACPKDRIRCERPLGEEVFPYCEEHLVRAQERKSSPKKKMIGTLHPRYGFITHSG